MITNLHSSYWLGSLFIITGLSILGLILYKDKQRFSDPCYKVKVKENRNELKQREIDKLKQRLLIFPSSNNKETIKTFVIGQVLNMIK